jgi:hypothetical protein
MADSQMDLYGLFRTHNPIASSIHQGIKGHWWDFAMIQSLRLTLAFFGPKRPLEFYSNSPAAWSPSSLYTQCLFPTYAAQDFQHNRHSSLPKLFCFCFCFGHCVSDCTTYAKLTGDCKSFGHPLFPNFLVLKADRSIFFFTNHHDPPSWFSGPIHSFQPLLAHNCLFCNALRPKRGR